MSPNSKWTQINAYPRSGLMRDALEARLADPLWLLARQRQFGALKGEDAGSPLKVTLTHGHAVVDQYVGADGKRKSIAGATAPVEPFVEADDPLASPSANRLQAEAALDFLARCPKTARAKLSQALRRSFPLPQVDAPALLRLLLREGFDAARLMKKDKDFVADLCKDLQLGRQTTRRVVNAFDAWKAANDGRFVTAVGGRNAWDTERLEYSFGLRASKIDANLSFDSYRGDRFDWYQAQLQSPSRDAFKRTPNQVTEEPLVTRVRYDGMPSRRYWSFEDGKVFFGGVSAKTLDLPQMVLIEFATVYAEDWYWVPVRVPTGALSRVVKVEVVDTFGETRTVSPAAVDDGPDRPWRGFELTGDASPEQDIPLAPWLYIPRVIEGGHNGPEIERVAFMRDEAANLMWAIESVVENASGTGEDRVARWHRIRSKLAAQSEAPEYTPPDEAWSYRIDRQVPPYWVPFQPEIVGKRPTGRLVRSRMAHWSLFPDAHRSDVGPKALVTAPVGPLAIHDEEIPRGGLVLTRGYQMARDQAGKLLLWPARKRSPAGHVQSSGREVDYATDASGQPVDDAMAAKEPRHGG